jgi:hypothetical protein
MSRPTLKAKEKMSSDTQLFDRMFEARTWILQSSSVEQCIELFKGLPLEVQRDMLKEFICHPKTASLIDDALKMKKTVQKK